MRCVTYDGRKIGDGQRCFIIFEAGATHNGPDSARRLIDVAAEAGADAIKFQILLGDRLMSDPEARITYATSAGQVSEPLRDVLRRRCLTFEQWAELKCHADARGLAFFGTIDFPETLEFVQRIGCGAVKICSGDVNHLALIQAGARTGLPLMLDTGSASLGEVERAVDAARGAGNDDVIIMHTPSGYPARLESIHLRTITTLRQMFEDVPVGFCDHSPGWEMDVAAVALGANLVEKTITLDRATRSPEHIMSIEPQETTKFVETIRRVEAAMGSARHTLSPQERTAKKTVRRGVFVARDLATSHTLQVEDLDFRRPEREIAVDDTPFVVGRRIRKPLPAGAALSWSDLQ